MEANQQYVTSWEARRLRVSLENECHDGLRTLAAQAKFFFNLIIVNMIKDLHVFSTVQV